MKSWLVAHRGAPREARENTIAAFTAALQYPIGFIELDIHVTQDGIAVVHHDATIHDMSIIDHTLTALRKIDPELATFEEVLLKVGRQPLFVELKGVGSAEATYRYLRDHPASYATSFLPEELMQLAKRGIAQDRLFVAQYKHPRGLLAKAQTHHFGGITLNARYLTPRMYWRIRRSHMGLMIYVVNSRLWARIIRRFYPEVYICTDNVRSLENVQ